MNNWQSQPTHNAYHGYQGSNYGRDFGGGFGNNFQNRNFSNYNFGRPRFPNNYGFSNGNNGGYTPQNWRDNGGNSFQNNTSNNTGNNSNNNNGVGQNRNQPDSNRQTGGTGNAGNSQVNVVETFCHQGEGWTVSHR